MNDAQPFSCTSEQSPCGPQIVAIFLCSAKRKLLSLELRASQLRTNAIRKAAHLAAGTDIGLEEGIIDACFRRQLHYDPADEYADNIAKVIAEITQ
jgi:hypothetical protein